MSELAGMLQTLNQLYRQLDAVVERIVELEAERTRDKARIAELEAQIAKSEAHMSRHLRKKALLPRRQMQILELVAHGLSYQQIADRLSISERTVRQLARETHKRLGVTGREQAAIYAWRNGIVDPHEAWETVMTMQWRQLPRGQS